MVRPFALPRVCSARLSHAGWHKTPVNRAVELLVGLLAGLLALLMLTVTATLPAMAGGGGGGGGGAASPGTLEAPDLRYEMPTLYLMLAPEDGRLPVRLTLGLTIELAVPEASLLLSDSMPAINDSFWMMLSRIQPSELASTEGMNRLREELLEIITTAVGYGQVTDLYFREFFTQQPI